MNKEDILAEIRRTAATNGGKALRRARFEKETGIKMTDWYPYVWQKWTDAQREASVQTTQLSEATDRSFAIRKLVDLFVELGHFPTGAEMRVRARIDKAFPSHSVFDSFKGKSNLAKAIISYCKELGGLDDLIEKCIGFIKDDLEAAETPISDSTRDGFVYLMKSGKHYKIGRTNDIGRRHAEIKIEMPEKVETIHALKTDDPSGIEAYWHNRFKDKRKNGEWFELTHADIKAFKRRKTFM